MDASASGRPSRERDFLDELAAPARRGRRRRRLPGQPADLDAVRRRGGRRRRGAARGALGRRAGVRLARRRRPTTRTTWRSRASSAGSDRGRPRAGGPRDERVRDPRRAAIATPAAGSSSGSRPPARVPDARPIEVTLVAVSKTVAAEALRDAVAAGLDLLGENRVQEAAAKAPEVPGARWQLDRAAPVEQGAPGARGVRVDPVGRFGRPRRGGSTGSSARSRPGARYPVLLQVNVDRDPAKAGFAPERRLTRRSAPCSAARRTSRSGG